MADRAIVFLMYHELELPGRPLVQSEAGYVRYILTESSFRTQIDWLRRNHWRGLNVSEALQYPSEKSVAITFDDGCETDLIAAAPVLKQAGFNATFYVTAGFVDTRGYLSASQLQELSSSFEIGCHSMTHAYLNDLELPVLHREIGDARSRLQDIVGKKVEHFSCPGGRFDQRALEIARQAGYRTVATSRSQPNTPATDLFQLGRVAMMRDTDERTFADICDGSTLWKIRLGESARSVARTILGNTLYDRVRGRLLRDRQ